MSDDNASSFRIEIAISLVGLFVLTFVGGAYVAEFEAFPYDTLLRRPFMALKAREKQAKASKGSVVSSGLWNSTRTNETGVTSHESGTYGGYTLVVSAHRQGASLVDMSGEVVHEWEQSFRQLWPDGSPHVDKPRSEQWIYWRRAHVMSNGDIVASVSGELDTPYGYGLFRLDKQSNVVWKYAENVHHDFDVQPDGSVVALVHGNRDPIYRPIDGVPQMSDVVLDDSVVKVDARGNEVKRVSLLDAIAHSRFSEMLTSYPKFIGGGQDKWDPLHTNYAEVVGEEFASHHAFAEPDHVMVSFRNLDVVALLDLAKEKIVWASRGFWRRQHNPQPMKNGHIMIFDNGGHGGDGGQTRILEFDPATNAIVWSYAGTDDQPLNSNKRGTLQPLPNDNVLVTESHQSRIFEVTRDGDIVWNYLNPAQRVDNDAIFTATLVSGERYAPDELTFLK